ncbi:hypothetical protein SEA_OGOPOGO_1 [Mycobacterium phage Ogopogo]|nr:hypothetical protein SEA_OGOPOGO_1 [Mycobacterium phage Ogopogo]
MTVKVYDRDGEMWLYEDATKAYSDSGHLTIYNEDGTTAGGFNAASWTHFVCDEAVEQVKQ